MFKKLARIAIIAVLLASALTACTWKEVQLQMQFAPKAGETYRVSLTADQDITQKIQDQEMSIKQTMGFGFSFKTTQVDENGNAWIDITYDRIQMKQSNVEGATLEYDSANPSQELDPSAQSLAALVGKGFSMKVSPSGEVLEISGVEKMLSDMLDELDIKDSAMLEQVKQSLKQQYSDEALKEQMGSTIIQYPEGQVKIGDTWTASTTAGGMTPLTIDSTYTLQAYENGIATVAVSSTISTAPSAKGMELAGYNIKYSLSGHQAGTLQVDIKTGWSLNSTITQTVSGEATLVMGEQDMTFPMSIVSVAKMEMIKE